MARHRSHSVALKRQHDLQPKSRRRFVATTDSNHTQPIFLTEGRTSWLMVPISCGLLISAENCQVQSHWPGTCGRGGQWLSQLRGTATPAWMFQLR
jgi:hypothetical protein